MKQEQLIPSNIQSRYSGGTSDILPNERQKASFNVQQMINILDGGKEITARKKFIRSVLAKRDFMETHHLDRHNQLTHHVKYFIEIHKEWAQKGFIPEKDDYALMSESSVEFGALNNHYGLFNVTLMTQGNMEQVATWIPKAFNFEIIGCYAQTELGHGSNVRALQTTATYDKNTQEFILDTPTLQSIKWWPGCLGKVSTHAAVYAQLIIDGKEHGVHVFMLQLRDENHLPLKGIELGDLGNKMGDNANDTGYMILNNVRIPRFNMLAAHSQVTEDGRYVKKSKKEDGNSKKHYATMMAARQGMIRGAASVTQRALTIAIRYNAVRHQGFVDTSENTSFKSQERALIDYKMQQYRLFKHLSIAYAMKFSALWMTQIIKNFDTNPDDNDGIKEIASTSAAFKAMCTYIATEAIEECRKCCGGNGYLLNSGLGSLATNYIWQVTAEGDYVVMQLLGARFLLRSYQNIAQGKSVQGVVSYLNKAKGKLENFDLDSVNPKIEKLEDIRNIQYLETFFENKALYDVLEMGNQFSIYTNQQKMNFDDAFVASHLKLMQASKSHCYYVMIKSFHEQINQIKDQNIKDVLQKLCVLFACTNMVEQQWNGFLNKNHYKFINQTIDQLLGEVRPNAVALVDAFDFPDNMLLSTIGKYDGNVYEALLTEARKSPLNESEIFRGYEKYLKPHLDIEFLKEGPKL